MKNIVTLEGVWQADIGDGRLYEAVLPGSLDENGIGGKDTGSNQWHPDAELGNAAEGFDADAPIATRFTRKHTYEGEVRFRRKLSFRLPEKKRAFLEVERARCLRLFADGKEIEPFFPGTLSTPYVFEVTECLQKENDAHELCLVSDNSYPGLPHDAIVYSSAATDETQTNWNGILGYVRLRIEEESFVDAVRVYPEGDTLKVKVDICIGGQWKGRLELFSDALQKKVVSKLASEEQTAFERQELVFDALPLSDKVRRWDEYEGRLYELTAVLISDSGVESRKTAEFGIRTFADNKNGRFALNGRTIFIRSETNCAEFPETGYIPMTVEKWMEIMKLYQEYGVNLVRFHSHCPPEAAFVAADRLGMLIQPELSHWDPKTAFETEEAYCYYRTELMQLLRVLANHPSFVMLTLGNELHASAKGHERMRELLDMARAQDATRMYADGSNAHYGAAGCDEYSDFYASQKYYEEDLRGSYCNMEGYINKSYPSVMTNYDTTLRHLRESFKKPVFSFEVGQYEILPDFDELEEFKGISLPANLCLIKERVENKGLMPVWKRYVEATGELSRLCYREEAEAALRTRELSGISLLGLQDFPGQGTALVGMLNSHLQPKPFSFARPERFREFFTDSLPLVLLPKYTYENTEVLRAEVMLANFGKSTVSGALSYELLGEGASVSGVLREDDGNEFLCPAGELKSLTMLEIELKNITEAVSLKLTVSIGGLKNTYPVWVYPAVSPSCPECVYETMHFDEAAKRALEEGKTVYLTPPSTKEALPESLQAQFSTDFWSVGTFAGQEGGMGQLIDEGHPVFKHFPTEFHTNWQWWAMAVQRAVILPKQYECIITEMDSYAYLRPMAKLLECRCGRGKILFSTMGLQDLQQYPEARALLSSIYQYLESEEFSPVQEIEAEVLQQLVR